MSGLTVNRDRDFWQLDFQLCTVSLLCKSLSCRMPRGIGDAYNSKKDFESSITGMFFTSQRQGTDNNVRSDGMALNLDEQGELSVGDTVIQPLNDDVVIMPPNTEYDYHGQLRLFWCMYAPYQEGCDFPIEHPPLH